MMATDSSPSTTNATFIELPEEIIQHILSFATLSSVTACQRTSKRLYALAQYPTLWRQRYIADYPTWHPDIDETLKDGQSIEDVQWKQLLLRRKRLDYSVVCNFDQVLISQHNRYRNLQDITGLKYDAKEVLTQFAATPDNAEDVLARRYWSMEALGSIERSYAIQEWTKLACGQDVPLERALGAYDLFALESPPETLDQIVAHLDTIAGDYKADRINWEELPIRQRCIDLIEWLHSRNYMGIGTRAYESLQNNFISIALCDAEHPSLPLISVSIFCCIAQRLGINAKPCGFLFHVIALIEALPGTTLDGKTVFSSNTDEDMSETHGERIYLDPYTDSQEIPLSRLRTQLTGYGVNSSAQQNEYLGPSSTTELLIRVARNITGPENHPVRNLEGDYCTVLDNPSPDALRFHNLQTPPPSLPSTSASTEDAPTSVSPLSTTISRHRARYAAYWAAVMFTAAHGSPLLRDANIAGQLNELLSLTLPRFRVDLSFFPRFITPILATNIVARPHVHALIPQLAAIVRNEEDTDFLIPTRKPRTPGTDAASKVKYRVGQVFRHKRYGYEAAITGWDTVCQMSEGWIRQMGVDRLGGGREQCFYHAVVADDQSTRYVAEENIVCLSDRVADGGRGEAVGTGSSAGERLEEVAREHDDEAGESEHHDTEIETASQTATSDEVQDETTNGTMSIPEGLARIAGRWFKRWDGQRGAFISNVKEEYPDD